MRLKSILTYGSEIWDTASYDVIEKFYLICLKQVLGVKSSTNTCITYAELGRHPMSIAVQKVLLNTDLKLSIVKRRDLSTLSTVKWKTQCVDVYVMYRTYYVNIDLLSMRKSRGGQ